MKTSEKIIGYIKSRNQATASELSDYLGISDRGVRKQLKNMLEKNILAKIGKPPKVFYMLFEKKAERKDYQVSKIIKNVIEKNFLDITPIGDIRLGWSAFIEWCLKRDQDVLSSAEDYVSIIKKYDAIRKGGLLDGMVKMKNTFPEVYLDQLFYIDFYSIERFGKTKLGKTLLYAKQSQDKSMIRELTEEISSKIKKLIKKYKIEAVLFVPPTVKREIQLMRELEKNLNLGIKEININKIKTQVIVPQKTLSKLNDRIENAKKTFVVSEKASYGNILIIDDAVGSGATLNEIAAQIRRKKIAKKKIIGLAITGSLKGFDVISEV